ncbi:probable disease resistance RPP8-like protein 2 [Syzygium oleosum]|uniref:probable disease resistance RPP8-like protein 2 n=1 Tax=Syzygium oleosum TaxID=219896 RepID=UPI0024B9F9CB|nr:probable disease resistance RPP8-like protein 2 [Syzygium oleosum]
MKDESHIVGREDFVNELVSQLIDKRDSCDNLGVISVVGEGAIGKTALVRSVCNRADIENHFDRCAWVRVGPEPNLVHLMVNLLKQLRVRELRNVERMHEEKLSDMILEVLLEWRYLIVLDDLCDLHLMDKLIMVLVDLRNGSRVIVTTRNPDIPSSIDPWYSTHLKLSPLNREQSEKLLEKCSLAFDVVDPPVELLHLKERILSKSGGSPPMILLLGGLLSATTLDRCTELANGLPDRPTLQDVVRLSVDQLPDWLKQCALYLTLFPKESAIPTRRLFGLWSAEKLVSSALENEVNRVDPEKCLEILVSRNMEKFDAPRVTIHRDISGGGEAKAQVNVPEAARERSETNAQEAHVKITPAEPHQRMSTCDNSMPCGIQQLCCYVSFNTMKLGTRAREIAVLLKPLGTRAREIAVLLKPLVPKSDSSLLKRDSSLLRVLDLEGVYKPLLPEELGNILPNLKYLGLRWTLLEWLPESGGAIVTPGNFGSEVH